MTEKRIGSSKRKASNKLTPLVSVKDLRSRRVSIDAPNKLLGFQIDSSPQKLNFVVDGGGGDCVLTATRSDSDVFVDADSTFGSDSEDSVSQKLEPLTDIRSLVLKSCSREKVSMAPGSVNCKRLLSYLMNMDKDNSFVSEHGESPKLEKVMEVKTTVQLLDSDIQEISVDKDDVDVSPIEPMKPDCETQAPDNKKTNLDAAIRIDSKESLPCVDDLPEYCVVSTPPDLDIFEKTDEVDRIIEQHVQVTPLNGESGCIGNDSFTKKITDQRNGSVFQTKRVLKPCSRGKVFKIPDSVSYRRLLPYLMDISKDNPSSTNDHFRLTKFENATDVNFNLGSKEKSDIKGCDSDCTMTDQTSDVLVVDCVQTTPPDSDHVHWEPPEKESCIDSKASPSKFDQGMHYVARSKPVLSPCSGPKVFHIRGSFSYRRFHPYLMDINKRNSQSASRNNQPVSIDRPTKESSTTSTPFKPIPKNKSSSIAKSSKLVFAQEGASPIHGSDTLYPPDIVEPLLRYASHYSPVRLEKNIISAFPHDSATKGVLKRNPRGCRGLCTCLHCSSFRLNAERTFQFSRNQMLDAEEVSLELIKELTLIRAMLETTTDASNDDAVIQANQVKEACESACKAEEVAKARLNQMNEDLNHHCRMKASTLLLDINAPCPVCCSVLSFMAIS